MHELLFRASGRDITATVVTVPELAGTFVEVETLAAWGVSARRWMWSAALSGRAS